MIRIWLGFALLILGIWFFLFPKSAFELRKTFVKMFGGKLTGSKKLVTTYKWVGVALFVTGLAFLLS